MTIKIIVPELGESVVEATIARWLKAEGDAVQGGEAVVELETDKVDLEIAAEQGGTLAKIERQVGEDVQIGEVLGLIEAGSAPAASAPQSAPAVQSAPPTPASTSAPVVKADEPVTPVAKRIAEETDVDLSKVSGSGMGGRITKQDVESYIQTQTTPEPVAPAEAPKPMSQPTPPPQAAPQQRPLPSPVPDSRGEERIRMSRRRRTIAERLVMAQQTAAMLTTFNEIDMGAVMEMRKRWKSQFAETYDVGLGFTSFFVKATIGALKAFPQLNAEIQENEIVLKRYYDIGVAIGAEEGLVVPVLRDADRQSFAQIEQGVRAFVKKSQGGTLSIGDLMGGTFTITNGGVFGSMLSTPILNPPQVGILGLHKIEQRPVVVDGEIVIRPMMYVALSYDHRIVDGREAVQFLVKVKELIEDPEALLLAG